jgi:large subunit ribosomal protein L29
MAAIDDLKVKTDDQLQQQLADLKREQFNLRFQSATNQLEKPSRVRVVRRTIARIRTLQNQRAAQAAGDQKAPAPRAAKANKRAPAETVEA